jgi:RNA polymerase sigma-70 factor (ECF subfamily)
MSAKGSFTASVMPLKTTRQVHEQEWGQLIAQTAQGDQAALATIYDRTSPQVYGLALKILGNRETAEEVTLDVYTQVWRQAHNYDETRGTPGSWLMTLARTRAIDRYRAEAAERGRIESLDTVEFFASDGETPEEDLAGQERRRYVQQALKMLTAEQRQAIALAYFYGLSQSEIADKLKLPLGTVKTRMRLGMIKLREALAPYEEGLVS